MKSIEGYLEVTRDNINMSINNESILHIHFKKKHSKREFTTIMIKGKVTNSRFVKKFLNLSHLHFPLKENIVSKSLTGKK